MARRFKPGLAEAKTLDREDALAGFRRAFALPKQGTRALSYLCGHSLGLMPRRAKRLVDAELERWSKQGVEGHFAADGSGWLDYHARFTAPLARIAGARRSEVVAMNGLTVNLHLMLVSFFRPAAQRRRILIEANAFPSDRYAVQSQLAFHGLDARKDLVELAAPAGRATLGLEDLERTLQAQGERIALVLLPGVQFLTGQRLDIAAFTALAQRFGCTVGIDLAHAIGNVPLDLHAAGPDFAVWCSYKYLNAGPGAVAGCFVHERWSDTAQLPRFVGWWGHDQRTRFAMPRDFVPLPGAEAWQLSNPPIFSLAPLAASLELFDAAGMPALRRKSERLTAYLEWLLEHELGERVEILTPRAPQQRGAQLSLRLPGASAGRHSLGERLRGLGVVADWRPPDVLRLAPVPLYNRYEDVYRAVRALKRTLKP